MRTAMHLMILVLLCSRAAAAQTPSEIWRDFAKHVEVGTELNVRLSDGQRVRAMLVGVRDDAVLLQPRTRIPVPVQAVPYDAIVRMEPRKASHGAGKAVAIGVASGVGVFFGIMAILFAAIGD